jgi:hypothetical protein
VFEPIKNKISWIVYGKEEEREGEGKKKKKKDRLKES